MENLHSLFSDYTFRVVSIGSILLGVISGVLGSFAVLRKQSLLGDAVSHAALPGVILAFLIIEVKNIKILLLGGFTTGILATFCIIIIVKNSKIKFDSALAMVLSVFFGLGMVLLTYLQKIPNANQAGIEQFIYGQASSILIGDIKVISFCGIFLLLILAILWKEFELLAFDPEFAHSIGLNINILNVLLTLLIVITIILGLQTVGVVLMSAMLIAPAVGARQWTNNLLSMVVLSAVFGGVSGVTGTIISSLVRGIPTGPVIVVIATIITIVSLLFAPKRGVLCCIFKRRISKVRIK